MGGGYNDILSSGANILSSLVYSLSNSTSPTGTYSGGYIIIGDILVQFTVNSSNSNILLNSNNGYTIQFPIAYTSSPWCVVVSPAMSNNNYGEITVQTDDINFASFNVYVNTVSGGSNIGLTYIAIGPRPSTL